MQLHAAEECPEQFAFSLAIAENVIARGIHHRLVNVHGTAGLALNGLGHKGRIHVVLQSGFPQRALEQENLIGQLQRVAVVEVDFELGRPFLMDQRLDLQPLSFGEIVDVVDQIVELVDCGHRIAVAPGHGAAGSPDRRFQRHVRVLVLAHQIELDFRRHDRASSRALRRRPAPAATHCAAYRRPDRPCGSACRRSPAQSGRPPTARRRASTGPE